MPVKYNVVERKNPLDKIQHQNSMRLQKLMVKSICELLPKKLLVALPQFLTQMSSQF